MFAKKGRLLLLAVALCALIPLMDLQSEDQPKTIQEMEALGETGQLATGDEMPHFKFSPNSVAKGTKVLLIPDSTNDVIATFDPFDGAYLGDLIDNSLGLFSLPINAIQGPDGNLYISDQFNAAVYVFDTAGNYLLTYADSTDGLNNVRGIDFRYRNLCVTSGDDYVAEFNGPHSRIADFINDGSEPFDIHFLKDGRALLCDIEGTADNVRLYAADGTFMKEIFKTDFPEQVVSDKLYPLRGFLTSSFSDEDVTGFDLRGKIHFKIRLDDSGRGIYRLDDGNLITSGYDGVQIWDGVTLALVSTVQTGSGWRFIEEVEL